MQQNTIEKDQVYVRTLRKEEDKLGNISELKVDTLFGY